MKIISIVQARNLKAKDINGKSGETTFVKPPLDMIVIIENLRPWC